MPYNFNPRVPRPIFWAVLVTWILATVTMLGAGVDGLYENYRFATESVHGEGHVENKTQRASLGRYGSTRMQSFLSYSYTVDGTKYSSGHVLVAGSTGVRFGVSDGIPIVYLRDEPRDSRPDLPAEAAIYAWTPEVMIPLGLLVLVIGVAALAKKLKR